jgi:thiol-disulfide isomerase/thioredoxin
MKIAVIRKGLSLILLLFFTGAFAQNKTNNPSKTVAYIFLSETCPICQSYTLTLKELSAKYPSVEFIGIFPNYYSNHEDIEEFKKKYSIPFTLMLDKNGALSKKLNAAITPEVFVINDNKLLYSGRIDDSFYAVGKRRTTKTSSELDDALLQITRHEKVKTPKTQAVGCLITSTK